MSGIIGGAGSKSGVIGETELDYEEGTWTPVDGDFDTWSSPTFDSYYTKIGRLVTCNLAQTGGSLAWSAVHYFTGLPFAIKDKSAGYAADSSAQIDKGPVLIWPPTNVYMIQASGAETTLVIRITYITDE